MCVAVVGALSITGCDGSEPRGDSVDQTVQLSGDCRNAALECSEGFVCVFGDEGWACLPEDGVIPGVPDAGPSPDAGTTGDDDTGPVVPDTEPTPPPELSIALVVPEGVLTGVVEIQATVEGDLPLGVEFRVDGLLVSTDLIPPYGVAINTAPFSDGEHTLDVNTADSHGQLASDTLTVTFDNTPPQVLSTSPSPTDTIFFEDGPMTMSMEIEETSTLDGATLRANGLLVADLDGPPWSGTLPWEDLFVTIDTLPKNLYLQFRVHDVLGQMTEVAHNVIVQRRLRWSYDTLGDIWGGAALLDTGNLVFGNHNSRVYAVTPDGALAWEFQADNDITAAPVSDPATGRVYVGSLGGTLYCLDSGGSQQWSASLGSPPAGPPVLTELGLYLAAFDGTVFQFDPNNGNLVWSTKLPSTINGGIAVRDDGLVYVGTQDTFLYAVQGGQQLWSVETGDEVWSTPAVGDDGVVYFGSNDGWVYAVDGGGTTLWETEIEGQIWSRLLLGDDLSVYVSSTSKRLHKLSTVDGTKQWDVKLGGLTRSSPTLDDLGVLYIGTTDGKLHGVDSETGDQLMVYDVGTTIHATPLVVDDRIYVGSMDRSFYSMWRYSATPPPPTPPEED